MVHSTDNRATMRHDESMSTVAEFTIEPFVEGDPGPHVSAAVAVAEAAGLAVDVGPFGTSVEGGTADVLDAVDAVVRAAVANGATRVSLQLTVGRGCRGRAELHRCGPGDRLPPRRTLGNLLPSRARGWTR